MLPSNRIHALCLSFTFLIFYPFTLYITHHLPGQFCKKTYSTPTHQKNLLQPAALHLHATHFFFDELVFAMHNFVQSVCARFKKTKTKTSQCVRTGVLQIITVPKQVRKCVFTGLWMPPCSAFNVGSASLSYRCKTMCIDACALLLLKLFVKKRLYVNPHAQTTFVGMQFNWSSLAAHWACSLPFFMKHSMGYLFFY